MNTCLPSWPRLMAVAPRSAATLLALEAGLILAIYVRPWAVGRLVDGALAGSLANWPASVGPALALSLLWLMRQVLASRKEAVLETVGTLLGDAARIALVRRLQSLPLADLERHGPGVLAERLDRDMSALDATAVRAPLELAATVLRLLLGAAFIAWMCPPLLLGLALLVPLVLMAVWSTRWSSHATQRTRCVATAGLAAACREAIVAQASIRLADAVEEVIARVAERQREVSRLDIRIALLNGWLQPVLLVLLHAGLGAVLIVGGSAVARGAMSYGELASCLFAVFLVLGPLQELVGWCEQHAVAIGARRRLEEALHSQDPAPDASAPPAPADAVLTSTDLGFAYDGRRMVVAAHASALGGEEELVLIRGPSGIGKSTLVQLLSGLLIPSRGRVRLGTQDIHRLPRSALRGRIAAVVQGGRLFAGTIQDNLRLALPEGIAAADADAHIRAVARRLGSHELIDALPGGYQTRIADGAPGLAPAVRQHVLLLRGVLGAPRVLILDEAMSALDGSTAQRLYRIVATFVQTLVIVDHRPAMAGVVDRVIDLEGR